MATEPLLRFLAAAVAPRRSAVFCAAPGVEAALAAAGRDPVVLQVPSDTAERDSAPGSPGTLGVSKKVGLLYIGADCGNVALPADVLVVATDRSTIGVAAGGGDGLESGADDGAIVLELPISRASPDASLVLAMTPVLPSVVTETLARIEAADRSREPAEPIDADTGALLYMMVRARRARAVLEIGTGTGAAAVWLATALARSDGRLTTVERDSALRTTADKNVRRAGQGARVSLELGDSSRVIDELDGPFDMVFLDEDPEDRLDDLDTVLGRCARGALLIARGAAADPTALAPLRAAFQIHPEIGASTAIRLGDGLILALRR